MAMAWRYAAAVALGWALAGCGLALDFDEADVDLSFDAGMDAGRHDGDAGVIEDGEVSDAGSPACLEDADCDDGEGCTVDQCLDSRCVRAPAAGTRCDDDVFCNGPDACGEDGTCSVHEGDPCRGTAMCDEPGRTCVGCLSDADCPADLVSPFGPCVAEGPLTACIVRGSQTRTHTSFSCSDSGSCISVERVEVAGCDVPTDGVRCGEEEIERGACGQVEGAPLCHGAAPVRTTRFECRSGSCEGITTTSSEACSLDGSPCGVASCTSCAFREHCDLGGQRTCSELRCAGTTCSPAGSSITEACSRGLADLPEGCRCTSGGGIACTICSSIGCPGGTCGCRADATCGCIAATEI